ncbi:hypothetical protein Nepgr_016501 [Nepenthes gracilis]|uniref:GRAM domain-containing protein n=1 Tax=Nepenthes gracilis TaxID=150966 RepID=A0AAD3SMT7_NEPGR|nr:hypothetical protein Nepgr_016501 [Nepenthes gracilis]
MEQTGRDQIQKNASDLEDSAQDMPPKVDCEAVGDGSNGDTKSGVNDADKKTAVTTQKSVGWSEQLVLESTYVASDDSDTTSYTSGSNPYVSHSSSPSPSTSLKERIGGARNVLGRWGSNVRGATKKAVDLAGNTWQHFKTSPSFADAAMGRVVHSTKVVAEGGYEKIFFQTFDTVPEESLQNSYACYLTTSAGPVMGTLYISTAKLAFCSDNPLLYKNGDQTEWSYYKSDGPFHLPCLTISPSFLKVVIPLHQLKAVNPSSGRGNSSEKYIQIISVDNHEFWYMGFLNYNDAVTCLREALQVLHLHSV